MHAYASSRGGVMQYGYHSIAGPTRYLFLSSFLILLFSVSKWPAQKTPAKPDFNPSASSSDKFSSKAEDQNKFTCFHCKQKGHRAFECPKRITLLEGTQEEPETTDDPKSEESDEVEEIEAETDGALLLVQKESIPTIEKKWLQKNIFRSTGAIHGQNCTVVIDGGSYENIISQTLVDRLKLKVYKHNRPYFVKWLMTGDEAHVRHTCQVTFAIGDNYQDTIWCDVLPIDSGDILLGRPWMYDKNGTHGMRDNMYTFMHGKKEVTLYPKKPDSSKKKSMAHATKEVLHVHHIYRGHLRMPRVRGRTLLST